MVPEERIELSTYPLPRGCATTTLLRHHLTDMERTGARPVAITQAPAQRKSAFLPGKTPPARSPAEARKARLAEALRANLKRRKASMKAAASARGQAEEGQQSETPGIGPQAGLDGKKGD
jgi:hypothetical protein